MWGSLGVLAISSCEKKPAEVTVTETRPLTTRDGAPKLFATSDERFLNTQAGPVTGDPPMDWKALPPSEFRLLNYRFGKSGTGEVWVSLSSGTVLANANRWLGQFKSEALDEAGLAKLPRVKIAGTTGVWVAATGEYGGMGQSASPGFALAGVVAQVGQQILTVKMIGPEAEVAAAKPQLEAFAASLRMAE